MSRNYRHGLSVFALASAFGLGLACADDTGSEGDSNSETVGDGDGDGDGDTDTDGDPSFDEEAVVEAAVGYTGWERINANAEPSQHGFADTVNMYVQSEHAEDYRSIDPDTATSDTVFPEGAIIVKEHLDADGEAIGLTIMAKAYPDYAPDAGDWWWARTEIDGTLNENGQVGFCIDCHTPRAETDFVFGVPLDNRN